MRALLHNTPSAALAWSRALERTASIAAHPERVFAAVIDELAGQLGEVPALLSNDTCLTYRGLAKRSNQYARWALDVGLNKGDTVCLLMPNKPEYLAIWLGISRVGGVVALLNTNLTGSTLGRCINLVAPKHVIVDAELVGLVKGARPDIGRNVYLWIHGAAGHDFPSIDLDADDRADAPLDLEERRSVTI